MNTVKEIYESFYDSNFERFFKKGEIEEPEKKCLNQIARYVPRRDYDDVIASVGEYVIACNRAGFTDGFKFAWKLFNELKGAEN